MIIRRRQCRLQRTPQLGHTVPILSSLLDNCTMWLCFQSHWNSTQTILDLPVTTVLTIFSRCFPLASAPLPPVSSSQQFVIWVNPILSTTLFLDWGFGEKFSHTWEKFRFFFLINGLSVVTQMIYFKFSFVKVRSLCLTSFFSHFCMYMAFFFPALFAQKMIFAPWGRLCPLSSIN